MKKTFKEEFHSRMSSVNKIFRLRNPNSQYMLRIFSNMIDMVLLSVVMVPFVSFISSTFVYGENAPPAHLYVEQVIVPILNKSSDIKEVFSMIKDSEESHDFLYKNNGLTRIFIDWAIQITIIAGYFISFWHLKQSTPGKMLLKLKIVDEKTGNSLTLGQSFIRFLSSFLFIGFLWIIFDKRNQSLHDKIAGTLVVRT